MTFILNKNLVFIDSMQFRNSILKKLVTNLSNNNFKHLIWLRIWFTNLELLKQKDSYPSEYINSFKSVS